MSGVAPQRSASPAQGPPPKRQSSPITPASLTPSSSQHEEPVCHRVVLETPPLTRRTFQIELVDLWNRYGIEYQIVGSSPNLMDMSLITHPVVEHPWIKHWSTPGVTSSKSSFVVNESSATSSSIVPTTAISGQHSQGEEVDCDATTFSSSVTASGSDNVPDDPSAST